MKFYLAEMTIQMPAEATGGPVWPWGASESTPDPPGVQRGEVG